MDPSIPNSNTSRNLDADGKPLYPSIYEFDVFEMINKNGDRKNISHLVTSFVIAEEIFSPVLTAKIRIRDNDNFFESFGLDGQEIVKVRIKYLGSLDGGEMVYEYLEHEFVVKDYPLFEKTKESINVQEYEINLISPVAYLSRLQQMSRGVQENPIEAIRFIFEKYLATSKFDYRGEENGYLCKTNNLKAVITQRTPLQAIEYLRSLCFDKENSPFFVYATLVDGGIIARSWLDIIDNITNPLYKPAEDEDSYRIKPFSDEAKPGTIESLKELRSKIISLSSNIKLDKLSQAVAGGMGSVTEVIDLEKRSYDEERVFPKTATIDDKGAYRFRDEMNIRRGIGEATRTQVDLGFDFNFLKNLDFMSIADLAPVLDNVLDDPRMSQSVYYLPIDPHFGEWISPAHLKREALPKARKYFANMETKTHEIGVYGDPNLKAGTKIKIEIPKAVDTNEDDPGIDETLSGFYIVSTSIHTFENGVYTNRLRIINDKNVIPPPQLPDDGSIPNSFNNIG